MIEIPFHLLQRISEHSGQSVPFECCGIFLGRGQAIRKVEALFEVENIEAPQRLDRYRIHGKAFLSADRKAVRHGWEIVGFYHSHPGGPPLPSATDLEWAWPGYSYLIVSLADGREPQFRSWILEERASQWREENVVISGIRRKEEP